MPAAGNSPRPLSFPVEFSNGYTHATASRHAPAGWWDDAQSIGASIWQSVMKMERRLLSAFFRLRPAQRIVAVVFSVLLLGLGIAILIYSESLFSLVAPLAQSWRKVTGGWLVLWLLTFAVAFPPLIGYSACVTAAGFVYGLRSGWLIAATASVVGATCAFVLSRTLLRNTVERLTAKDPRFAALSLTIKHDGLKLLIMIRLCPLPFSLSNGAMSTIPSVHWASFALATACATPKLFLHVFIGSRMAEIAEHGGTMDAKTKAISYISIICGSLLGIITGWVIYRQTTARARQLEADASALEANTAGLSGAYIDDDATDEDDDLVSLQNGNAIDNRIGG